MMRATAKPTHYENPLSNGPGKHPRPRLIPRWVDCDVKEFERMLNAGELEPCSDAEWRRICGLLHMATNETNN